ncbi:MULTISPECIES: hypothetical protein [Rhodococcus]|uniref:hypothetical protein n=1 Tax=Rhodococcus TaxID=1827 RepID=UPI0010205D1C|nr:MULTISPECIES: hypothetical protein [Rhodococcus]UTT51143.1 hypothetical protein NMQ04_22475 [Rhodococcus gordoniae]
MALALSLGGGGLASAQPTLGPLAPPNPFLGPNGTSTMHGDAGSSDTVHLAGPDSGKVNVGATSLASACPTLLQGSDSMVVALCSTMVGRNPTVHLIDTGGSGSSESSGGLGSSDFGSLAAGSTGGREAGASLAELQLPKGSLLGGVYAYLDNRDRLIAVDGNRRLVKVGHYNTGGQWSLSVDESVDLSGAIAADDAVTGLASDWNGNVWFATGAGRVGVLDATGVARAIDLPAGERVENSISTSPTGTSVATTHALYQLSAGPDGTPHVDWRNAYDRGSARKPGQLSWGTGSTPTYFGPGTGHEYVAIVDSADTQVSLLVYRESDGRQVCRTPVLTKGGPGSENSPIGVGSSVFVAGTYGYPYPAVPDSAGPSVPDSAPFAGGMTRVDVTPGGCTVVWDTDVKSSAVPRLSTVDDTIYTVLRKGTGGATDGFAYAAIDPATGAVRTTADLPGTTLNDTIQMAGLITAEGDYLQGTLNGFERVSRG